MNTPSAHFPMRGILSSVTGRKHSCRQSTRHTHISLDEFRPVVDVEDWADGLGRSDHTRDELVIDE